VGRQRRTEHLPEVGHLAKKVNDLCSSEISAVGHPDPREAMRPQISALFEHSRPTNKTQNFVGVNADSTQMDRRTDRE